MQGNEPFHLTNGSDVKYAFLLTNGSDVKYVFPRCRLLFHDCFCFTRYRSSRSQPSDGDASSEDAPTNSLPKTGQREAAPQDGDGRRPHKAAARLERAVSRTGPPRRRRRKAASVSDSVEKADADVVSYQSSEDFTDLPSPFSVHAVRLDLRHQFVWSARRFGVAFWVRLSSASHSVGCDLSPDGPIARSGDFSPEVEFDCEVVLHLLSLGSGKNWIEVWLMPSCGTLTFRYLYGRSS